MLSCQECLCTAVWCGKLQACFHPPSTQGLAIIIPFLSFSFPTAGSWELLCITPLQPPQNSVFLTFPSLPFYFSSSKYKSTLAGHAPAAAPLSSPCPRAGSPLIPLCGKWGYKTPFLPRSSVKVWQQPPCAKLWAPGGSLGLVLASKCLPSPGSILQAWLWLCRRSSPNPQMSPKWPQMLPTAAHLPYPVQSLFLFITATLQHCANPDFPMPSLMKKVSSISIEPKRRSLYARLKLTLSNPGFTFQTQVSPSEWFLAGYLLPQLHGCCWQRPCAWHTERQRRRRTAACQLCPALVAPTGWWLGEQTSVLTSLDTRLESVCLSSVFSSEIFLWPGVRAAE